MNLAFHLGLTAYLVLLAGCTMTACQAHLRAGDHVEAVTDAGFTLVLVAFASLVLAQVWP